MSAALAGWVEALAQQLEALGQGESPMVVHARAAAEAAKAAPPLPAPGLPLPAVLVEAADTLIDRVDELHLYDEVVSALNRKGLGEPLSHALITASEALKAYQAAPPASSELEDLVRRYFEPMPLLERMAVKIALMRAVGLTSPAQEKEHAELTAWVQQEQRVAAAAEAWRRKR